MDLSPGLLERGHDVVIGCRADSEIERRAKAARIPILRLEMQRDTDWSQIPVFLRAMRGKFDVVHIHHYLDYLVPAAAARLARIPAVVMTRHLPHPFKTRATAFVAGRVLYHRIIAVSEFIARVLIQSGVASNRITVVNNGIDPEPWQRAEENHIRNELQLAAGTFLVCAAGRLFSGKGFDVLVRAIGLARQRGLPVQCAIAGSGDEMQNLQTLRTQLGLTDAVHLLGFRNDVPALFAAADAVAVPSTWAEPFGYVVVEAMASGRPVIGSQVGGMTDIITPEVGFLLQAGDPNAIADAIEHLVLHPEQKQAMERSSRARAAQFSLSAMVSNVEQVFDALVGGGGRGGRTHSRKTLAESRA